MTMEMETLVQHRNCLLCDEWDEWLAVSKEIAKVTAEAKRNVWYQSHSGSQAKRVVPKSQRKPSETCGTKVTAEAKRNVWYQSHSGSQAKHVVPKT